MSTDSTLNPASKEDVEVTLEPEVKQKPSAELTSPDFEEASNAAEEMQAHNQVQDMANREKDLAKIKALDAEVRAIFGPQVTWEVMNSPKGLSAVPGMESILANAKRNPEQERLQTHLNDLKALAQTMDENPDFENDLEQAIKQTSLAMDALDERIKRSKEEKLPNIPQAHARNNAEVLLQSIELMFGGRDPDAARRRERLREKEKALELMKERALEQARLLERYQQENERVERHNKDAEDQMKPKI